MMSSIHLKEQFGQLKKLHLCWDRKLMWGSDYPRTITAITYRMSYDFIIKSSLLTEEEKRLF